MVISESTRKIHRNERIAKGIIWGFAILTIIILFWIIGFILLRGFYSDNLLRYDYAHYTENTIPLGGNHEVIFIAHKKLRIEDLTTEDLQGLYSSPIRELNSWDDITGQDLPAMPAAYLNNGWLTEEVQHFLLKDSGLDDWKNYTVKESSAREMIEYVAATPGSVGFISAEDRSLLNKSVQVIPIRDMVLRVHPSVTAIVDNRSFQALNTEQLDAVLEGKITHWKELDGRELPLKVMVSPEIDLSSINVESSLLLEQASTLEELDQFLEVTPGALVLDRKNHQPQAAYTLLPVDRRERGRNLTLAFIFEKPAGGDAGGISYFIINTLLLIVLTLLFSTPIGVMSAIYLVEYARQGLFVRILRMGTETLAGIPSIVFGLFGRIFFVRIMGLGIGFLSSTLTVTLMILPTLVRTTEEALKSVPDNLREGSLAMGATRLQTILRVVLPAASSGILTGIILAVGRVVGETAVLLYTLGSGYDLVRSLSSPARVLSLHLYLLFSEAVSFDRAFATGTVLIIIVLITNLLTRKLIKKQTGQR